MDKPDEKDSNPFMDALPPAVRAAIEAHDTRALEAALRQMPYAEAEGWAQWLLTAGVLEEGTPDEPAQPSTPAEPEPARSNQLAQSATDPRFAGYPPAVAAALATGNVDAIYAALAELLPAHADRLFEKLKQDGLL